MFKLFRKWLDPARRHLDKRLQLALSAGKMAAWELNVRTGDRWWSPEMFALHGLPPDAEIPPDYDLLVYAEDRERVRELVDAAVRSCSDHMVDYRVVWPDTAVHWLESSGATLCDDAGQPELMIGVCVNVDARKEEEHNLQFLAQASAELAALSDYSVTMQRIAWLAVPHFADWCAVDMLDRNGSLHRVAVAHVDPQRVKLAHELHERYPPDPKAPGGTWNVIRTGRPQLIPIITNEMLESMISDSGHLNAIRALGLHSYMGVPLVSRGKVLGVISFITSESHRLFTERHLIHATDLAARAAVAIRNAELMEALQRSDAAKDVFLATLAHELRNPLAPIVNAIALLTRATDPASLLPNALAVMQRQTSHLTRLVDDLLDFARINSGKIELRRQVVELREVLRTAAESSQPLIDRQGHSLALELPGEPVAVDGDPVRLTQIFSNLLNNAAKFTPPGGRIELRMAAQEQSVQVIVSDSGVGIPPEVLPQIFELFTQAPRPDGTEQRGLGIGLFLVKALTQMHDGSIAAESPVDGQGSRFTVTLPCVPSRESTVEARGGGAASPAKKVLVVDDNADAAQTLAQLLQMLGHSPATAHDGASALARFAELAPDVVLLDIGLPDMNGYEVARRIRASGGTSPKLVALTGWGQPEDKRRAAEAGFDAHWTKPVDPAKLEEL